MVAEHPWRDALERVAQAMPRRVPPPQFEAHGALRCAEASARERVTLHWCNGATNVVAPQPNIAVPQCTRHLHVAPSFAAQWRRNACAGDPRRREATQTRPGRTAHRLAAPCGPYRATHTRSTLGGSAPPSGNTGWRCPSSAVRMESGPIVSMDGLAVESWCRCGQSCGRCGDWRVCTAGRSAPRSVLGEEGRAHNQVTRVLLAHHQAA